MSFKKYIDIVVRENKDGEILPVYLIWEDGHPYEVQSILSKERKNSEAGGGGICYLCMIDGKRRNLYLEKNKWFLEINGR